MQTNTSKWLAFFQGVFYLVVPVMCAQLVIAFGAGGVLYGTLPWGLGILVSTIAGYIENQMQAQGKGALFGLAN